MVSGIYTFFSHIRSQVDFPLSKWSFPINLISLQNLFAKNFLKEALNDFFFLKFIKKN